MKCYSDAGRCQRKEKCLHACDLRIQPVLPCEPQDVILKRALLGIKPDPAAQQKFNELFEIPYNLGPLPETGWD